MFQVRLWQALTGLLFFAAGAACAGSFAVSPVRISLSEQNQVAAITVRNTSTEATVVQLEPMDWSQTEGVDGHQHTRHILATPPIFTLAPGGSQIVRVGMRSLPPPGRELAYRLFLQEVPPPAKAEFRGLRVALRISMPVFFEPSTKAPPDLRWQATRLTDGKVRLTAMNRGNAHVQVASFSVAAKGAREQPRHVSSYLLAGQSQSWLLEASTPSRFRVMAQTDAGELNADVIAAK